MINLLNNEHIILVQRRHWLVIATEGVLLFFMAFSPLPLLATLYSLSPQTAGFLKDYWLFIMFYQVAWMQLLLMIFFVAWTNYYLDVVLVTNKRVIDIEQINLFSRDIAEIGLENIQDIKIEISGVIASLLKIGNLHIQTAGYTKEVLLKHMPEVSKLRDSISKCRDEMSHQNPNIDTKTTTTL